LLLFAEKVTKSPARTMFSRADYWLRFARAKGRKNANKACTRNTPFDFFPNAPKPPIPQRFNFLAPENFFQKNLRNQIVALIFATK